MRYALVDDQNTVWTVAEADEDWQPPVGYSAIVVDETVGAGDVWDGKHFTRPELPTEPPRDVTVGQLVDIAIQLGILEPVEVFKVLPVADDTATKVDGEGQVVVDAAEVDVLVNDAITKGTVTPVDGIIDVPAMDEPVLVEKE